MVTQTLSKQDIRHTMKIKPNQVLTNSPAVYSELVESIKNGIRAGDSIPACKVIPTEKLRGRIPSNIFEKLGSAKYVLESGNHRAFAYYDSGLLINAEPANIYETQDFIYSLESGSNKFMPIFKLKRLNQRGALETRINQGKFYRRN